MQKVILIGGSPRCGKSTVARMIASELKYHSISTDDFGEILQTEVDINPMRYYDYTKYYSSVSKERLISDTIIYHDRLQAAIEKMIEIHSSWSTPIVIEGWALYPEKVKPLLNENVTLIWLIAEEGLFEKRFDNNKEAYTNQKNLKLIKENYLFRSEWHNNLLKEQCEKNKMNFILVNRDMSPQDIVSKIYEKLNMR